MVKDLIKNVKYEQNIKPHIVQICQILGYSPQTTQKIVKNKISGLKNFELKWIIIWINAYLFHFYIFFIKWQIIYVYIYICLFIF